jgi:hypothetical protein
MTTRSPQVTNYQHPRVIVRVDSHVSGVVDLSRDVVEIQTSKSIKSPGHWQIQLVPRQNYLNLIFPNDLVNIYIDPGDGKRGFVRTMFGYIDRIDRSESVSENGAMMTRFAILGSDFQKAIDQTSIYFNPYLQLPSIDSRFNVGNITSEAASPLKLNGLQATGTPADFVESMLQVLMGFGQQWILPQSYRPKRNAIEKNRDAKLQRAKSRIPENILQALAEFGLSPQALIDNVNAISDLALARAQEAGTQLGANAVSSTNSLFDTARTLQNSSALEAFRGIINTLNLPPGVVDLLDFGLIVAMAIDGFVDSTAVWTTTNSTVSQLVYGHTNQMVNELIFDLRPVVTGDTVLSDSPYSTDEDELGLNTTGTEQFPASVPGIQYVPAVVLREYPYSVVQGYDLGNVPIDLSERGDLINQKTGFQSFGPIFAKKPNQVKHGRVIYDYEKEDGLKTLAPRDCDFSSSAKAVKHLDVVSIYNSDVRASSLGRSDEDVYNLFAVYARNAGEMQEIWKFTLQNFCPIMNPISIARHGLRVREEDTEFANYGRNSACLPQGIDNLTIRRNLVRWSLLMDHWYQHNIEYLSGTIELRGMPEIRVGYRLDWVDRRESYYVMGVTHRWEYISGSVPGVLSTSVEVSRGQRNDPFPAYIPPIITKPDGYTDTTHSGDRSNTSRLSKFFQIKDTMATRGHATLPGNPAPILSTDENEIDKPNQANGVGRAEYSGQQSSKVTVTSNTVTLTNGEVVTVFESGIVAL